MELKEWIDNNLNTKLSKIIGEMFDNDDVNIKDKIHTYFVYKKISTEMSGWIEMCGWNVLYAYLLDNREEHIDFFMLSHKELCALLESEED
jgi:hypothetical protein